MRNLGVESKAEHFLLEYAKRFGNVPNADNAAILFDEYDVNPFKMRPI